jgi:hypothetical protein
VVALVLGPGAAAVSFALGDRAISTVEFALALVQLDLSSVGPAVAFLLLGLANFGENFALVGSTVTHTLVLGPALQPPLALVGGSLAVVGQVRARPDVHISLIRHAVAGVGDPVASVCCLVAFVGLALTDLGFDLALIGSGFASADVRLGVGHGRHSSPAEEVDGTVRVLAGWFTR